MKPLNAIIRLRDVLIRGTHGDDELFRDFLAHTVVELEPEEWEALRSNLGPSYLPQRWSADFNAGREVHVAGIRVRLRKPKYISAFEADGFYL